MKNAFFLITGTSKGIGETLAQSLLKQGNTVLGVSRSQSAIHPSQNYHYLRFDLANTSALDQILDKANGIVEQASFDFLCLVNNASLAEPLKAIEACSYLEIDAHVRVGLIAPMVLTAGFIHHFGNLNVRKKIVFVSSGAGNHPILGASIYSSTKAGINLFTQAVGGEQQSRENGVEVIAFNPGMVDTPMQEKSRSKSTEEFASAGFFKQAKEEGRLQERSDVIDKILTVIENQYENGRNIYLGDL